MFHTFLKFKIHHANVIHCELHHSLMAGHASQLVFVNDKNRQTELRHWALSPRL
ncbi:MAG: hypothetical protein Q7K57_08000 [Burkholderiaceae bacterium]|nr:hypothetical protein [Burkholderiaceae bacterium]